MTKNRVLGAVFEVPVIFFHLGNQEYLKSSLCQCKRYNQLVILLGDETNKNIVEDVQWFNAADFLDKDSWISFKKTYCHMSSNSKEFELTCFKRFFVIHQFIRENNIDRFVYLDSDVLCYVNYSDIEAFTKYDVGMCVPKEQGEYRWVANCGISLWTADSLKDFLQYCVDTYNKRIGLLKEKYNYHISNGVPGGICDMTLQYLWYVQDKKFAKLNLVIASEELCGVMDYNVNSESNYLENEYLKNKKYGIKAIEYHEGIPFFVKKDGTRVRAFSIHFLGGAKGWLCDYQLYMRPAGKTVIQYNMARIKNNIRKFIKRMIRKE